MYVWDNRCETIIRRTTKKKQSAAAAATKTEKPTYKFGLERMEIGKRKI